MSTLDERQYHRMLDVIRDARSHRLSLVSAADGLLTLRSEAGSLGRLDADSLHMLALTLESAGTDAIIGVLPPGRSLDQTGKIYVNGLAPFVLEALDQLERIVRRHLGVASEDQADPVVRDPASIR